MSKVLDQQLLTILKGLCENDYFRPTKVDIQSLEQSTQASILDISHSLNNLQRNGLIRISMGRPGEESTFELIRQA